MQLVFSYNVKISRIPASFFMLSTILIQNEQSGAIPSFSINKAIEGACKNLVGRRLKQMGACWRVARANRIATIAAVLYSDQWKYCWKYTN